MQSISTVSRAKKTGIRIKDVFLLLAGLSILACGMPVGSQATPANQPRQPAQGKKVVQQPEKQEPDPSVPLSSNQGIDVSHFQGTVRWDMLKKEGIGFAFVKATGGTGYTDPMFAQNWETLREEQIPRGAYHFFYPNQDAAQQAEYFITTLQTNGGLQPGDLPPVLDVEVTNQQTPAEIIQGVQTWLTAVKKAFGCTPIIYVDPDFANQYLGDTFKEYPLWVADYSTQTEPTLPTGWEDWLFWQYSENGTVTGVNGAVDTDRFNGSAADLQAMLKENPCK